MKPITVIVHGAMGKMGKTTIDAVCNDPDTKLVGAVDVNVSGDQLELANGAGSVPLSSDLDDMLSKQKPDVMVDFSIAEASMPAIRIAAKHKVNLVIGTTGHNPENLEEIKHLAEANNIGAIFAANFAIGAVLMNHLAKTAGKYFDHAEIIELHHDMKLDAPSGTALSTAREMIEAKGKPFNRPTLNRGKTLKSRGLQTDGITIHSVRLPGFLAHQEVILGAQGQTLSIRHDTNSRECFMPGVLLAIKAVTERKGLTIGLAPILGL